MAFGQNSTPAVPGIGQSGSDDRALFLKVFGGEVLTAFTAATIMKGKTRERVISSGKSAQFPLTGSTTAEYMSRGQEALGNPFATHEREITLDGLLVSHYSLWDLDQAMSHFDVRGPITSDMGQALARVYDQNAMRSVVLAARTAAVGEFPGGDVVENANLTTAIGSLDGLAYLNALRAAKIAKVKKNLPANGQWYFATTPEVFDAIKYAVDANGNYVLQNREFGASAASYGAPVDMIRFEGITIMSTNLLPQANDSANAAVWAKYRADYSRTKGILWTPDAVGTLQLMGVAVETDRDARRQEDFMIARMAVGHGTLRPEFATEFRVTA